MNTPLTHLLQDASLTINKELKFHYFLENRSWRRSSSDISRRPLSSITGQATEALRRALL
jgi:hypothetical protein